MQLSVIYANRFSLLSGAYQTMLYSVISLFLGLILGTCLALMRESKFAFLRKISWFYVWIFRGTPLMVQLFIIYFGIAQFHITLNAFTAGIVGLTLNNASYISEIVRSGIAGVDKGEREAAKALGMSFSTEMLIIVAPQATKNCLLPMINQFVSTIKGSSILSVITVSELTRTGQVIANSTFQYMTIYLAIGFIYLLLTSLCNVLEHYVSKRLVF